MITNSEKPLTFPEGFLWGAATSPTQIEGHTRNEWADFRARDGSGPDEGCDHWNDFERDFSLLEKLGLNSYRLGLDWGRLQNAPKASLNPSAVQRYREMLYWLQSRDIEPFVTLFHFACPKWLAETGGWANPGSPEYFADFTRKLAELDLPVKYWVTINEPGVYLTMSYLIGLFPPMRRLAFLPAIKVFRNMARGHIVARRLLKRFNPEAQVGIAKHFKFFLPHRKWHVIDRMNSWICKSIFANKILNAFTGAPEAERTCDFIGVNYYGRLRVKGFADVSPVSGTSRDFFTEKGFDCDDMWEQDPEWMGNLLPSLSRRYGVPLYITETGFATEDEDHRIKLFLNHLHVIHQAIQNGADVRGLFYWTLMDNFEWAEGFTKRFGLAETDFACNSRSRRLRDIALVYSDISKSNSIPAR